MLETILPRQAIRYLSQVFGEDAIHLTSGGTALALPYFLQDRYDILTGHLLGYPVALACIKSPQALAAHQIEQHTKRLAELLKTPVIVALPEVAPGERKQLIQRGIAFLVPGKQLFAPRMGMILTERFASRARKAGELASPATQALLVCFLNQHPVADVWHPFEEAAALGYAGMTATRAVRELLQFGLFELEERGRAKYLKLTGSHRELWEKSKPHLRSPVLKTLWTYDRRILDATGARWAGESALARLTMLNEPLQQVIALSAEAAQEAEQTGVFFEPRELADAIAVQVWRYLPAMLAKEKTVDPLSLWLSLKDQRDERIRIALDEIEENFPVVKGLAMFQEWFSGFEDQYVLIGGTAASITMSEAGLPFRGTRDLDIVLHVEVLTPAFGRLFWEFVQAGGYFQKEGDPQKRPCLYRFQKPQDDEFPYMLELFSRVPAGLDFVPPGHLTPIPIDEQISSLSAILLEQDYYQFVMDGRKSRHGMPSWVGEDRLIPLKAVAWMEMTERVRQGESIDSKKINKHFADIVKLSALLQPDRVIPLPEKLRADLQRFVQAVAASNPSEYAEAMRRIAAAYAIGG